MRGRPAARVWKTYGVSGMIEWHVMLPASGSGRSMLAIDFTGGQISGYGVSPARFTTADPFVQRVIEESCWYREKKRIVLLNVTTR